MPRLNQYDYIFAIGTIFAALDAYNIGANDVANSFATSVSSRSLTLRQACVLAGICEFLGAVLVGAKVSGTIKNGIISLSTFQGNAGVEMLAFTCAITASASWLMLCTIKKWPVSTTYSIVSALLGVGVATGGWDAPRWGWNGGKGVATIFAGFGIAPAIAAGFASTVYLITKFIVLVRNNPVKWGLIVSPVYFFTVAAVLTMSIVYKGAPDLNLDDLPQSTIALAIVLTGLVIAILSALFWLPFVHCTVVKKDYTLRWYHVFYGPLLWKRPAPEPIENSMAHVTDYRVHRRDNEHHETSDVPLSSPPSTAGGETETKADPEAEVHGHQGPTLSQRPKVPLDEVEKNEHKIEGFWWLPKNLWIIVRYKIIGLLLHGSGVDIHAMQADGDDKMAQRLARMHERSHQYANETEHLYSFLQVMTACTASFAHGSNDVSNAIGPFAAIYQVWNTGRASSSSTPTPTWMLAFGAGMIVVGLATYGYNIMAVLGNRLTMHSPSRGFSMELGASITVLLASQFAIPVSSTMCIVGATAGVGIVSNGFKAVNWRTFGWIFLGWVITVPAVSIAAGCLMGIILNAPRF